MSSSSADDSSMSNRPISASKGLTHGGFFGHLWPNRRFIINIGPNFGFGLIRYEKKIVDSKMSDFRKMSDFGTGFSAF